MILETMSISNPVDKAPIKPPRMTEPEQMRKIFFSPSLRTKPAAGMARMRPQMENTDMIHPYDVAGMANASISSGAMVAGLNMFSGAEHVISHMPRNASHEPFGTGSFALVLSRASALIKASFDRM